jgi:hypothetical protein
MLVALDEAGSHGGGAEFSVSWNGGFAIENEIAMRCDVGRVDLGADEGREADGKHQDAKQLCRMSDIPADL